MLWDEIEFLFGEFDIVKEGWASYGGYYAYTDEQGNKILFDVFLAKIPEDRTGGFLEFLA